MNDNESVKSAIKSENDAFSDLLTLLRLDVDIYHNAKVCGDWQINEYILGVTCFHLVTIGSCLLDVPGHIQTTLHCGDLVIFPKELVHSMRSVSDNVGKQQHLPYHNMLFPDGTGMLCGEVTFHHKSGASLLADLPPVFIIPYREDRQWMKFLLDLILSESLRSSAASKAILNKLSEILFTYALRQHLTDNPTRVGLLSLYVHDRLSKAIHAIHQFPEKNWTLHAMAAESALSRSVFAQTFKEVSGWTPGQYLLWWRMQTAWSLLTDGASVVETAELIGYRSEAAFSRAFRKMFGVTVGQVRRGHGIFVEVNKSA